jgi:hypothetical protein
VGFEVPSVEEFKQLGSLLDRLTVEVDWLKEKLKLVEEKPSDWVLQSEACKYFIGRNGTPISANTFRGWILDWLKTGDLVIGENCRSVGNSGYLIKADFLKGKQTIKHK